MNPLELVGTDPALSAVRRAVEQVADTDATVLILGETGTGKELVARAVHAGGRRRAKPFVPVSGVALSPGLIVSELFGHEAGAFTGANRRRVGRFEQADGGTLFLDEVGELGIDLQAKLLRVLQGGTFERVGGEQTLRADVRVVAATNRDLPAMIAAGTFREDLYYRLNVVAVELPPLGDRREDIPLLAEHLIRRLARKYRWPHLALAPDAVRVLCEQPWPGNVRQMQNVLARAAILSRGRAVLADDLRVGGPPAPQVAPPASLCLGEILAETERRVITEALTQTRWNRTRAAELMGISRRQLFDKIQEYDLRAPDDRPEAG